MTDLEDLWDDLPVGPAPVDRIIRAGRAVAPASGVAARRRAPRWLRPLGSVGALAALGGAFLVGVQVAQGPAGPDDGPPAGSGSGAEPAVFSGRLVAAGSCEALLEHYRERGAELVGPYGWEQGGPDVLPTGALPRGAVPVEESADATVELSRAYRAPVTQSATSSETGTNVQEAGVDEPDVVKTDGTTLWRVDGDVLTASAVGGEQVEQLAELDLGEAPGVEDLTGVEILLAGDTVVALGRVEDGAGERTLVLTVDAADPAAPAVRHVLDVDSGLVTARLHGGVVRLVTAAGLPDLPFTWPGARAGQPRTSTQAAAEQNEQLVRETSIDDWLPTASLDGAEPQQLADCGEVAVPRSELGLDTVSVLGFDATTADPLASLDDVEVTTLAAATTIAYASAGHLYLAASTQDRGACPLGLRCAFPTAAAPEAAGRTQLFDFALAGTGADHVGSGEVDGLVADRWAMDEQDGVLRLAVGASSRTGDFNSVLTLRREGDELVEVGRLDRLGVNEQIESVRWFEGLAIVVTFRQVDPLYTVDLTDAEAPTLLGELKIPGFSEYLHPLGSRRLIGIGQGPVGPRGAWGAQAALFKVRDLTDPRRLAVVGYAPGTQALAGGDPRQFTWLPEQRVALTVVARGWRGRTGWVSALRVQDGTMTNQMVVAEHGTDVDAVRLVPLPDGRVVLSTPSGASFFAV